MLHGRAPTSQLMALLMAAALLSAGGCRKAQPPAVAWEPVNAASLHAARQRWAAARIEVYDYLPYCEVYAQGQRHELLLPRVTVRSGRASSALLSAPSRTGARFLEHGDALSMDGIFDVLERSAAQRPLTAVFDPDTGVPLVVCDPHSSEDLEKASWAYCAVGAFHVPRRHGGNPERLRWPGSTPAAAGSCPHASAAPGSPG